MKSRQAEITEDQQSIARHINARPSSAKTSKDQRSVVRQTNAKEVLLLSVGYIYILYKHHSPSQASAPVR